MHALQQHPNFSSPISGTTRYHNFSSAVPFTFFISVIFFSFYLIWVLLVFIFVHSFHEAIWHHVIKQFHKMKVSIVLGIY
jgi:predicted membrane protein